MDTTEKKKSRDFNIYYLNFSKVYEIAMMINNVILTKIETDKSSSFEEQYGFTSSISAQGTKQFLDGIKASISADARETSTSSSKVVESLDVKTTKSILLRRIIEQCASVTLLDNSVEGDLVKVDRVKLELLNEESLRQFLILRRDALKGMRVEGMEVNNLVSSMLQDYAYILKGLVYDESMKEPVSEIIIKIPMEIQSEFENKYNINDLLIGHVSIVGIYKGIVSEEFITSNTFTYFQEAGARKEQQDETASKIIKSNTQPVSHDTETEKSDDDYHFVDTLAIIQDVAFKLEETLSIFLFGASGIGKTEVARLIASGLQNDCYLAKINFQNYSSQDALNSLIGSPAGYVGCNHGELSEKIQKSKVGVLLCDEFEKTTRPVFSFFLELLEEGRFTDSMAREYDMDGYVIIFTSNLLSEAEYKKAIPTELQTRFDLVCEFEEPTMAEKTAFLDLLLEMAKTKYSEQFAEIEMTEDEKKQLYAFDYSSLSALRDIKRVFNNRLMDYFAEKGVLR